MKTLPNTSGATSLPKTVLWLAIAIYVALRLLALVTVSGMESPDSPRYLINALLILEGDLEEISKLAPDHTPFYPLTIAVVGLTGISMEVAGRLASFAFSLILLVAIIGIGRRLLTPMGLAIGVLLLAVNPVLVPLSVSVLSEPVYIGTVYLGMWLFWRSSDRLHAGWAAALGAVFALAFLNRVEGLLFLGAIPVFVLAMAVATPSEDRIPTARMTRWIATYVLVFVLMAAPQVWWVSDRMGGFAINGRQVWSLLSTQVQDASAQERQQRNFRLDFSPAEPNAYYAHRHPDVRAELKDGTSTALRARLAVLNVQRFYWRMLPELVGPGVVAFFLFGLVALWRRRPAIDTVVAGGFLMVVLAVPLLHSGAWLKTRHVAIVAPLLLLLSGEGIRFAASLLTAGYQLRVSRGVSLLLAAGMVAACVLPLRAAIRVPDSEYDPESLQEPIRIIRELQEHELDRPPVVAAMRSYLPQMAGLRRTLLLPVTDMDGLMRYLWLNEADLLFLEYEPLAHREFLEVFRDATPPECLTLIYEGEDGRGGRVELYRVGSSVDR